MGVEGSHVNVGPSVNSDTAVVRTTARDGSAEHVLVTPQLLVRVEVVGHGRVIRRGHVHDPILDDGRVLEGAEPGNTRLEDLSYGQLRNVGGSDALQSRVPLVRIISAVGE